MKEVLCGQFSVYKMKIMVSDCGLNLIDVVYDIELLKVKFTKNINHRYFYFLFELPSLKMSLICSYCQVSTSLLLKKCSY